MNLWILVSFKYNTGILYQQKELKYLPSFPVGAFPYPVAWSGFHGLHSSMFLQRAMDPLCSSCVCAGLGPSRAAGKSQEGCLTNTSVCSWESLLFLTDKRHFSVRCPPLKPAVQTRVILWEFFAIYVVWNVSLPKNNCEIHCTKQESALCDFAGMQVLTLSFVFL